MIRSNSRKPVSLVSPLVVTLFAVAGCGGNVSGDEPAELGSSAGAVRDRTPRVVETRTLAPLAGPLYTPAPGQEAVAFHATDLGFTVAHEGKIRILFGDTWINPTTSPLPNDDAQGTMEFAKCPAGDEVEAFVNAHPADPGELSWQRAAPPLTFATQPEAPDQLSMIRVIDSGVSLETGPLRVPHAVFSDGGENAFAMFTGRFPLQECRPPGDEPACDEGLTCEAGLGSCFPLSTACVVGAPSGAPGSCPFELPCLPSATGLCRDTTSSVDDGGVEGRIRSVATRVEIGLSNPERPEHYTSRAWPVNKFVNPAVRTVRRLNLHNAKGAGSDYRPADGKHLDKAKVLVWGRPAFFGSQAQNREAQLYFAYADMPAIGADGAPTWSPRYFTGLNTRGVPEFSSNQLDAVPLDLSGGAGDPHEPQDAVNQTTVSWVASLDKWVMFYGGENNPILSLIFNPGAERTVDGAILVRYADQPWGPWTTPQPLLVGGDPADPFAPGNQFGPGGILFHPACTVADCVAGGQPPLPGALTVGGLYGPNIVDCWTEDRKQGQVDLYWNVSTSNPYQVVLMKTRLAR
jgi:hypothetical protein